MKTTLGPVIEWLYKATAGIRFKPDRKAVRAELEEHLEDKALDLQRIFPEMTAKEARERAAADMGDPVEIGTELAQLHRPWLGYLWRASQAVLAGALLVSVFTFGGQILDGALDDWRDRWEDNRQGKQAREMIFGDAEPNWEGERLLLYPLEPDVSRNQGVGTFTASQAALWLEEGEYTLYIDLQLDVDFPWQVQEYLWSYLTFTDSLGTVYDVLSHRGSYQEGLDRVRYNIALSDFDPAAEWVRLDYWFGAERLFSMTLELDEGGGTE